MAGIRDPQIVLNQLYAARDDLLTGKAQSYSIGDRNFSLLDMATLDVLISKYENIIAARTPIFADLSGIAHLPFFPEG